MKVGKVIAFAVGGGIIILQVAAHQGYIKINWDKVAKKADKITDKVEEKITGEGPKFMDKVRTFFGGALNVLLTAKTLKLTVIRVGKIFSNLRRMRKTAVPQLFCFLI